MIQPLWKMVWRFLKKLGIKPPYDPAIPLLGMYPEDFFFFKHGVGREKIAKMVCSDSLVPRFVNNDYVTVLDGITDAMDMSFG